ncbi:hypothetical protein TCRASSO_30138 [Tenacibaculum crassostreae]
MNRKLNNQYFETKKTHKEGYKKNKLTLKRIIINVIITFLLVFLYNKFSKYLSNKIEQNKAKETSSYIFILKKNQKKQLCII